MKRRSDSPANGYAEPDARLAPHAIIRQLALRIDEVLMPHLEGVRDVALVDFPNYGNVGDAAIYLGTLDFLHRQIGIVPGYVCDIARFSAQALRRAVPDGPILINGGGNLGDLWPPHQKLRETLLQAFPQRRIIQLPQSIQFDDPAAQERFAAIVAAHGNFLLLVRDHRSEALARRVLSCDVALCPDMAFSLGPLDHPVNPRWPLLLLLRDDKERVDRLVPSALPIGTMVADWVSEPSHLQWSLRCDSAIRAALSTPWRALDGTYQRKQFYCMLARHRLRRGIRLLASAERVITDWLHAHILCLLLGIPHVILDNSYGKVFGFADTWTDESALVRQVSGLEEALAL